jgi:hypothetical protein
VGVEELYGESHKNVYGSYSGSNSIFDIKTVDNADFAIRKFGPEENLFDLELSFTQKENIVSRIQEFDSSASRNGNSETFLAESEMYMAYYDDFKNALVNYVKYYRENDRFYSSSAGSFSAIYASKDL